MPKKASIGGLVNNLPVASERLKKKLKQLERHPDQYQRYNQEVMKFVEEGHAEEIVDFEPGESNASDGSYYIPHHAVVSKTDSTEKWRIVFDCSAKAEGADSLNDLLLPGPDLNPQLVTLLLNFRVHPVAVSADVAKAYMMIALCPSDQRLFRFLWRRPGEVRIRAYQR